MLGSVGSMRATKPSPPVTMNQSLLVAPCGPLRPRRAAERAVVLRAAVDVVDRRGVVDFDVVELRDRQVAEELPQSPAVPRLVQSAVAALEQVIGVVGIDPDVVVVDVLVALADGPERASAVQRHLRLHARHVQLVGVLRIRMDVLVVHRLRLHVGAALPAVARVVGGVDRGVLGGLDLGVDQALLRRRKRRHDAAEIAARKSGANATPGGAAVGGLVNAALRAAVDQRPGVAPALMRGCDEHVGIVRIHRDVADAGVLADVQDLRPVGAAVGRLVETAIAAGRPQRPVRRDVDDLRIARIDHDAADVLRILQPEVPPRAPGIVAAIHAVAVADAALVVRLAGADPNRARVLAIDRDGADRIGALVLHDGREGRAGVGGLPHPAGRDADVPRLLVLRMHRDRADAA